AEVDVCEMNDPNLTPISFHGTTLQPTAAKCERLSDGPVSSISTRTRLAVTERVEPGQISREISGSPTDRTVCHPLSRIVEGPALLTITFEAVRPSWMMGP